MLEQRYNLSGEKRKVIHEGKSLYENVIEVGLKTNDKKNELYKKHALSSERGLDYTRGMKDIKTFNSHMPDVLRRLDFYFNEENKTISPVQLETEQITDFVEQREGREIEQKEREEIKAEVEEEYKKIKTDTSKLKSGKGKSVFASKELPVEQFEEEKKEDNENEPEPVPNRFAQPKGQDTDYDKPNQEQEDKFNDFMKGATTDDSKRFGLIVIDKEGNINKHYKSITEFKDDKENYNKFNKAIGGNFSISKRQSGISYIAEDGEALYFVPLKSYRDHYETKTWVRRHKKLLKKKNENEKL